MTMMDSLEIIADLMYSLSLPCGHSKNVQICSKTSCQVSVFRTVGPLLSFFFSKLYMY